ncbi:hypothetical protein H6G00_21850 [Leptolyngbya sp. FACHB-541]|uniref:hypothetical protein n=1 Tax=Leptolyngbya sp. FACHB-541 TaxID=2692810 RepID=UPI001684CE07|nr:hypothetical protein [Leptolyngbya sp. FACHB-541]MBD1999225.1 hypothetical protein [Leptolyngbya sp. FACHB-541]
MKPKPSKLGIEQPFLSPRLKRTDSPLANPSSSAGRSPLWISLPSPLQIPRIFPSDKTNLTPGTEVLVVVRRAAWPHTPKDGLAVRRTGVELLLGVRKSEVEGNL